MSTPTPRTYAAKIKSGFAAIPDGFYDHARGLETELVALTAERDQLRADRTYNHECINRLASATGTLGEKSEKVVDVVLSTTCGELSCDECNARTAALIAERDQLRAEVEAANKHCDILKESNSRACAEVERLGHLEAVLRSCAFDKDGTAWKTVCGWWSKKYDAVERQMSDNATRAELADAELATERARLDWVFHNCKVTRDDFTVHDREDLGVAMKEGAK